MKHSVNSACQGVASQRSLVKIFSSLHSVNSLLLSVFVCVCLWQTSSPAALEISTLPADSITRTSAWLHATVVSTNGSTNAVNVSYFYATSDGGTNTWTTTNSYGTVTETGAISNFISGLTPSQLYYHSWYISEATNFDWATSSNFTTLAGVPTNTPMTATNFPVIVNSFGTVISPANASIATAAQGTNADNWAASSNQVFWLDGRYAGDRSVWGSGLVVTNIFACYGSSQHGQNLDVMTIGAGSHGASQRGYNLGSMTIGVDSYGAFQNGWNNFGTMTIGGSAVGASQWGKINSATAVNNGKGSMQLFNLTSGQSAQMTGNASLGLGACTVSNNQSIVVGDGSESHGDGSITASGGLFHGHNPVLTNPASFATAAQGTNADHWASNSNQVFWLDGRYSGNRSVWGSGLSTNNIATTATGAAIRGVFEEGATMTIGEHSYGSVLMGRSAGNMNVQADAIGALIAGYAGSGALNIGAVAGSQFLHTDGGDADIGTNSPGASQHGFLFATEVGSARMSIDASAAGASQHGRVVAGYDIAAIPSTATNSGIGAMQLFDLTEGQQALTTDGGSASVLLGAGISSNKNAIVAGDGAVSHGDASITAAGGLYAALLVATNLPTSTNGLPIGSIYRSGSNLFIHGY
jgi:hypothetical protein